MYIIPFAGGILMLLIFVRFREDNFRGNSCVRFMEYPLYDCPTYSDLI